MPAEKEMWGLWGNWILCLRWSYLFMFHCHWQHICLLFGDYAQNHQHFPLFLLYLALIITKLTYKFYILLLCTFKFTPCLLSWAANQICIFIQIINTKKEKKRRLFIKSSNWTYAYPGKLCAVFPCKHFFSTCSRTKWLSVTPMSWSVSINKKKTLILVLPLFLNSIIRLFPVIKFASTRLTI